MTKEDVKINLNLEDMQKSGLNFGHRISKLNPKMKPYIAGIKNTVHMIDLNKTAEEFERALKFIANIISEDKVLLFVGTKIQMRELTKQTAKACNMPYVSERWFGGIFTNFDTISKRVQYFKDLEKKKVSGQLEKYTKKERINFDREIESLRKKFEGIKNMEKLPEAVLILDLKKDSTCQRESRRKAVKIIGVVDTNIDPTLADYPVPANDDAISSISYILDRIKEVILTAKQ